MPAADVVSGFDLQPRLDPGPISSRSRSDLADGLADDLTGKLDDGYYGTTREMFEGLGVGMGFDPGPFLVSLSVVHLTGVLHFLSSRRRCEVKSATNTDERESSAGDTPGSWI